MIPKEIKYNLHYDDVRGDFLRPPHGTTQTTGDKSDGPVRPYYLGRYISDTQEPPQSRHTRSRGIKIRRCEEQIMTKQTLHMKQNIILDLHKLIYCHSVF